MNDDTNEPENEENDLIEPSKPKRGRPAIPKPAGRGDIDAKFEDIVNSLHEVEDTPPRTMEEIIEFNKKILTKIQNILLEDLKTIHPKNMTRITTPNGIAKFEIAGLPKETRVYLMSIFSACSTALKLAEEAANNHDGGDDEKKFEKLATDLYKGIPGLKNQ